MHLTVYYPRVGATIRYGAAEHPVEEPLSRALRANPLNVLEAYSPFDMARVVVAYYAVAYINVPSLDECFREMNVVEDEDMDKSHIRDAIDCVRAGFTDHTSLSVGDVLFDQSANLAWICLPTGWREIPGLKGLSHAS